MEINLSAEIEKHFKRLDVLAQEAEDDTEGSLSSRASAMATMSSMLRELTKTQAEVINMERLMRIEAVTIEVMKEFLPETAHEEFLSRLEKVLNDT